MAKEKAKVKAVVYGAFDCLGNAGVARLGDGTILVYNMYEKHPWYNQRTRERGTFDGTAFYPSR